jgi:hypothetical protein
MKISWNETLLEGVASGTAGAVLSGAALAAFGYRETGWPTAPINAVSHWYWHPQALRADEPSLRHTGVGFVTHHAASVLWGTVYAIGRRAAQPHQPPNLLGAVATAAFAAFVDFKLTPDRFTPGFEHRLSTPALIATYGAMALGMLLGARAIEGRQHVY